MKKKTKSPEDYRMWYRYHFFGSAVVTIPKEKIKVDANIANISLSGLGLYSSSPIGKGKKVAVKISFVDRKGKRCEDVVTGKVDWQKKFKNMYLTGILFDEELNVNAQPKLVDHLIYLIDAYNLPQPYKDKRIAML